MDDIPLLEMASTCTNPSAVQKQTKLFGIAQVGSPPMFVHRPDSKWFYKGTRLAQSWAAICRFSSVNHAWEREGDGKLRTRKGSFVPALGFDRLTALYDPLVRITTGERVFKKALTEQIPIEAGQRILDLACGTGTLTIMLKSIELGTEVVGIDGDANILRTARAKIVKAGVDVGVARGVSFDLPFADGTFDHVVSSLFFHHLTRENKLKTLFEVSRVLKPGGEFHVADWGLPTNTLTRFGSRFIRLLDGRETTADNLAGRLPALITAVGFEGTAETNSFNSIFGTVRLHSSRKPE